ncbi:hypothetical protein GOV10_00290, partial [Candidatus Woesearchaeota archaeon]|nr:hypothetical protein [Candidatus Woesearchaeota archaeon]
MSFRALITRILQSCNPLTYGDLSDEKFVSTVRHFFTHFFILFVLMAFLFVPAFFMHADSVQGKLSLFTSANITGEFSSEQEIELLYSPRVVFDENATGPQGAQVVFGNGNIFYRPFYFFGSSTLPYS